MEPRLASRTRTSGPIAAQVERSSSGVSTTESSRDVVLRSIERRVSTKSGVAHTTTASGSESSGAMDFGRAEGGPGGATEYAPRKTKLGRESSCFLTAAMSSAGDSEEQVRICCSA